MKKKLMSALIIVIAMVTVLVGKNELPKATSISATVNPHYQLMYLDGVVRDSDDDTGVNLIVTSSLTKYYGSALASAYLNAEATGDYTQFYAGMGSTKPTYMNKKLMTNPYGINLAGGAKSGGQDIEYTLWLTGLTSISDLRNNALLNGYPNTIEGMRAYADDVYDKKVAAPTSSNTKKAKDTTNKASLDYSKVFDSKYYASKYPDLSKAGITSDADLLKHFKSSGMKELRQGNSIFNPVSYIKNNPDLVAAYGTDYQKYYEHYMQYGYKEQRIH